MLNLLKNANLALAFILELCALAALAYWGFSTGNGLLLQIVLGIGAPLLMIVVWGILLAPMSTRRLRPPIRQILTLVVFGAAALALVNSGHPTLALIFALTVVVNMVLIAVWKQDTGT